MEIKSCEQYVLSELHQTKWDNATLQTKVDDLTKANSKLSAKLGSLQLSYGDLSTKLAELEVEREALYKAIVHILLNIDKTSIDSSDYEVLSNFAKGE